MDNQKTLLLVIGGCLFICCCVTLVVAIAAVTGGLVLFESNQGSSPELSQLEPTRVITVISEPLVIQTPESLRPTPAQTSTAPLPEGTPELDVAQDMFQIIQNEVIPINDPIYIAERLENKQNIPEKMAEQPPAYAVGDQKTFQVTNSTTNENFEVKTILRYETDHLYFWIEDDVEFSERALKELCETFEHEIYPTNRDIFGSEWTPGVDNDPHLFVVYAGNMGDNVAGLFSASDEYHPDAREYSNGHEMFMMNSDIVSLSGEYIYSTMAHEFQHMIHWYQDRNEDTWVSEAFSTLSQLVNGYEIGGSDFTYTSNPDIQLNTWPNSDNTFPHYGASFLFASYFLDRYGTDTLKTLISLPENGMQGFDRALELIDAVDPVTGAPVRADDLFADWVVASYLNDPSVGDGRYVYQTYDQAPSPINTEEINDCSSDWQYRDVNQYGVDYVQINCNSNVTLKFEGERQVRVFPADVHSGQYAFWSNKGDESNMTLTREFDFTHLNGSVTLTYFTWYDLETDYDYLYVEVSEDGENWEILKTPSGTDYDPSGNSYGWGYNSVSDGWIEESIDLSKYAGKKVQIRFDYITDMAVNGEGFLLDDVRIPEIGYSEDFESGDGGWLGDGFVRLQNQLPQTFYISIIRHSGVTTVESVSLQPGQSASIPLGLEDQIQDAVLVVSGTTRYTSQLASYHFWFEK